MPPDKLKDKKMSEITFTRPIDGAFYAFNKLHLKVFPIKENGKTPAVNGWQDWADSATEKQIMNYGTANPLSNWAIYCGASNLCVIDIDTKPDRDGFKTMKEMPQQAPQTLTISTPSGGRHLYYVGLTKSTNDAIGTGVDTKSRGGYVLAPGSIINNNRYQVLDSSPIATLPAFYTKLITEKKKDIPVLSDTSLVPEGERNSVLASLAGTMRNRGMSYEAIYSALLAENNIRLEAPLPDHEIEIIARSISGYAPSEAMAASDFLNIEPAEAITCDTINPEDVPKRDWIMQDRYIGGFISVVVAPGGVGKSTLTMLDAVSIATGHPLTNFEITKPGGVWIYNTEDPMNELKRRIISIATHHELPLKQLKNVHITSGRERPLIIAKRGHDGIIINKGVIDANVAYIRKHDIKVLIVDPFVRSHEVSENDNMEIDKVVWGFQRIADQTGCAVCLVHHTSKHNPGGMDSARGASSLVYAARIAHVVQEMDEDEAKKFGISKNRRHWYVRLDNAKANLQAPAAKAYWFKKVSVTLANTDHVGTIETCSMDQREEVKKKEVAEAEKLDIALALYDVMGTKLNEIPIRDIASRVTNNPEYDHLFGKWKSEKAVMNKIIQLLTKKAYYAGNIYEYFYNEKLKVKHWVRRSVNKDLEALLC